MKQLSRQTNHNGRPFTARLVERGDRYGLNDCLTYDHAEPVIEVYDDTTGQFTGGRYFVSTFLETARACHGIMLQGGVPAWTIDAGTVVTWAEELADCPSVRPFFVEEDPAYFDVLP